MSKAERENRRIVSLLNSDDIIVTDIEVSGESLNEMIPPLLDTYKIWFQIEGGYVWVVESL